MPLFKKKTAAQKAAKKAKKAAKKVERKKSGGLIKRIAKKAKTILPAGDKGFAILLPFKGMMRKRLEKKNVKHDGSLKSIAIAFAKHVSGGKNFENFVDINNPSYNAADPAMVAGSVAGAAVGNPQAIAEIIKIVVDFIKGAKAKKEKADIQRESGVPVTDPPTPDEEEIAVEADEVAEETVRAADNTPFDIMEIITSPYFLIVAAIIVSVIVAMML